MRTTFIPKHKCSCGYEMDAASQYDGDHRPEKDDISLCFGCGKIYIFNGNLTQREPTKKELEDLKKSDNWSNLEKARTQILGFRN